MYPNSEGKTAIEIIKKEIWNLKANLEFINSHFNESRRFDIQVWGINKKLDEIMHTRSKLLENLTKTERTLTYTTSDKTPL